MVSRENKRRVFSGMMKSEKAEEGNLLTRLSQNPESMGATDVAELLGFIRKVKPDIMAGLKLMDAFLEKALARIESKNDVPGFVSAPGRNSYNWKDAEKTLAVLKYFYPKEKLEETGLKSVNKIKTLLRKRRLNPDELLKDHIVSSSGKPIIKQAVSSEEIFQTTLLKGE
jgi:hypothetical protein